jgi:hypothetical protein
MSVATLIAYHAARVIRHLSKSAINLQIRSDFRARADLRRFITEKGPAVGDRHAQANGQARSVMQNEKA